jgi:alpha 1,6-mannosyltransferase
MHWQTAGNSIDSLDERQFTAMATWRKLNPEYRYELLTNANFDTYVVENYAQHPDILTAFRAIKDPIIRSDFIRYLALYTHGGVYSDLDTIALKPVATWIPPADAGRVNLVIGVEIDEPGRMQADWTDNFQFCQSTLMARAGHGMLKILIKLIVDEVRAIMAEHGDAISTMEFSFKDVLRIAGPAKFSTAVFQYLSLQEGRNVTRDDFVGMDSAKRIADVLVLTANGFVPGQDHSRSGTPENSTALVQHLFLGSWKSSHSLDEED